MKYTRRKKCCFYLAPGALRPSAGSLLFNHHLQGRAANGVSYAQSLAVQFLKVSSENTPILYKKKKIKMMTKEISLKEKRL